MIGSTYINTFLGILTLGLSAAWAQQTEVVDFKRIEANLTLDRAERSVSGTVKVEFLLLQATDEVYLDAKGITLTPDVQLEERLRKGDEKLIFEGSFTAGQKVVREFSYTATPSQTMYFFGDQVWTQGQGKYTSHWLPSIDDMNDKIEFDITFSIADPDGQYRIISNGIPGDAKRQDGVLTQSFDMEEPMSSYLVAVVAGQFTERLEVVEQQPTLRHYLPLGLEDRFEATYRHTREIMDFLIQETGVTYPWQDYKQVPVRDFLYAGMENTAAIVFSEAFVVDSIGFTDRNYVNVNAHEMAHQWFGNLVTEVSGKDHWLHEGFASFYALQAEKHIFGSDYYYWKMLQSAERLQEISDAGKGQSLLDSAASSLTFYEKGAWALHQLQGLVGEVDFRAAITDYLNAHQFENVTTADFLAAIKRHTLVDISTWENMWLEQTAFPASEAFEVLRAQEAIRDYFQIAALRPEPLRKKAGSLRTTLLLPNDYSGQEAVYQLAGEDPALASELYSIAFKSGNIMVRQAIALSLERIPPNLRSDYETLLKDPSYVTRESALYHLWINFPADRARYLDQTSRDVGFQDKSLRQLWLVLALATDTYLPGSNDEFIGELRGYSGPEYSFEVRQNALEYIHQLDSYDDSVYLNLVEACTHPNWRFRSVAREILEQVLEDGGRRAILARLRVDMNTSSRDYLDRALGK